MEVEWIAVCLVLFVVLILSLVFYQFFLSPSGKVSSTKKVTAVGHRLKKVVILFLDSPDPDNPASAAAIYKHIISPQDQEGTIDLHLHIVLTGRPVDLSTSKALDGVLSLQSITRQSWEKNNPYHAQKVLCDAAARFENYLKQCGIDIATVTIYNGGVAPNAPISDQVHDWDFLFDRKDLITGQAADQGQILSPKEYSSLVNEISTLSQEDREKKLLSLLRPYQLTPLSALKHKLEHENCEVILFIGGPATAVVELFEGERSASIRSKVVGLYAMFGSLEPGKRTLLPNQFNVACDIEAACDLFVGNLFPQAEKYLITTETAKDPELVVSAQELHERGVSSYFVKLQELWESTHQGKPQPMFDVFAVMVYLEKFRECFRWSQKKAVLQEWRNGKGSLQQVFSFADSDDSRHVLVSETHTLPLNKATVVEFLHKMWT